MPVDVIVVAGDPGHGRVPGGWGGCFDVIRLLNADMKTFRAVEWMGASQGLERQCRLARLVWRRVQPKGLLTHLIDYGLRMTLPALDVPWHY